MDGARKRDFEELRLTQILPRQGEDWKLAYS
jgi:hypothetical protein